jgi:hypothetical protein
VATLSSIDNALHSMEAIVFEDSPLAGYLEGLDLSNALIIQAADMRTKEKAARKYRAFRVASKMLPQAPPVQLSLLEADRPFMPSLETNYPHHCA